MRFLNKYALMGALLTLLLSCTQKQERIVTPYGSVLDSVNVSEDFDLAEIQTNGELIMATLNGPETYYDYHGKSLGTQYLICQQFADSLGVRLRVDVCRDSAELVQKLRSGDVDLVAWAKPGQIDADPEKTDLVEALRLWNRPSRVDAARQEETALLTVKKVRRRIFSPMLDKNKGIISNYDGYFMTYSRDIRWDWRLMAAQCYQESTFDPKAVSFAGAKGLMQIMPGTADHLGVARDKLYDPETNIAAAAKLIKELQQAFSDIRDHYERTNFVLASYNGGSHHIRDAMALARRDGKNASRWAEVAPYVLKLATAQYYNDPIVKYGYMRGSETVDYVEKIRSRHASYQGVRSPHVGFHPSQPRKADKRKNKFDIKE
ncbi:MAG: transglycosylase SLT domain-containing protein [Bacteroidaceae bacterium]|nr:transglycosylase SLT domain-containing protein [Bacteroidaceae bacterium]